MQVVCIISQMITHYTAAQKLRTLLIAEKSDCNGRLQRYKSLTLKIADYQVGVCPAPTEEEFTQWLADVEHAVSLKTVLSGG